MTAKPEGKLAAPEGVALTPAQLRARKMRNVAIGLAVGGFALLFYIITIVKMNPGLLGKAM